MLKPVIAVVLVGLLAPAASAKHAISQKDKRFSQESLQVKTGDTVVFSNDDTVTHNVFSVSAGNQFNLKTQAPGTETPHTFTKPGTVEIRCAFHPTMKLNVVVQ